MNSAEEGIASFRLHLLTVLGQALAAAGYTMVEDPVREAGGLFLFQQVDGTRSGNGIEFQLLAGVATEWAPQMPSRFRVTLLRGGDRRTLAALVVSDFRVQILPTEDHWWAWQDRAGPASALAEAGHLLVGFGLPWLSGELKPP